LKLIIAYKARSVEQGQWVYVNVVRDGVATSDVSVRDLRRFIKRSAKRFLLALDAAELSMAVKPYTRQAGMCWCGDGSADRHDGTVAAFGSSARQAPMSFLDDVLEPITTSDLSVGFYSPSSTHRTSDDSTDPFIKAVHIDGHLQCVERILHDRIGISNSK
jgi:hypothetical protein